MKIRHRVPVEHLNKSAALTPEYQAEVDRTMAKAESAWRRAQRRLASAQRRLERARTAGPRGPKSHARQIAELEALVELRRTELEEIHRQMTATGAPATSRGRKSHRHINLGGAL
jgi:hypothetical protein